MCKVSTECGTDGCRRKHSKLLHHALEAFYQRNDQAAKTESEKPALKAQSLACGQSGVEKTQVALPVVTVWVKGSGQQDYIRTNALLDTGSNRSFCSLGLVDRLGIEGKTTTLSLETVTDGNDQEAIEVSLEIMETIGKRKNRSVIALPRVFSLGTFPKLRHNVCRADVQEWQHLKDVHICNAEEKGVELLIGQDTPKALIPLEVRYGGENEPYATRTALGWTLNGPLGRHDREHKAECFFVREDAENRDAGLEAQVERFWQLDAGQAVDDRPQYSVDDKRALDVWERSISQDDGHYQMDIPFKTDPPLMPNNRTMAATRLQSLGRRLEKNPDLHSNYISGMEELIAKGYAQPVPPEDMEQSPGMTWYLPHHNVVNKRKLEKFRIVFDCAAQYAGKSLNSMVLQGPDLTNKREREKYNI